MAVENTEKIHVQADPMEGQAYHVRKAEAASSGDSVYSPAASVNDKKAEKAREISQREAAPADASARKASGREIGVTKSQLEEIADGINKELSFFSNSIQFRIEEVQQEGGQRLSESQSSGDNSDSSVSSSKKEIVVTVIDKRTGEVIRRIPPDDLLQSLNNASMFIGLLIDQIV